ncbi:MAG: cytochrome-c peroxidase [Actinomycetota bacterium]
MRRRNTLLILVGVAAPLWAALTLAVGSTNAGGSTGAARTTTTTLSASARLGRSIFFDQQLSIGQNQSCASCHDPAYGWVGPKESINAGGAVYEGSIAGRFGDRKPPSAAYATQAPVLHMPEEGFFVGGTFWDGRATGERLGSPAAEQALGPFLNPVEQGLPDAACVVYRVVHASYPVSYRSVWGWGVASVSWPADVEKTCATEGGTVALSDRDRRRVMRAYDRIGLSVAAYEGSSEVNAFTSKFDAWKAGRAHLTDYQRRGLALFRGKGQCDLCHTMTGRQPLLTDYTYDNLGIPKNPANPVYDRDPAFVDLGLGGFLRTRSDYAKYASENDGKFKVPTLRNVDLRPTEGSLKAYGHNGYFKSLREVVHYYNTRDVLPTCRAAKPWLVEGKTCWPAPENAENVNHTELGDLGLTPRQEAEIVAFLKMLSDGFMR